jgi:hypothetical protein
VITGAVVANQGSRVGAENGGKSFGPKAQPFIQRRAEPWIRRRLPNSGIRAEGPAVHLRANCRAFGPNETYLGLSVAQGCALRWMNGRPFGARTPHQRLAGGIRKLGPPYVLLPYAGAVREKVADRVKP